MRSPARSSARHSSPLPPPAKGGPKAVHPRLAAQLGLSARWRVALLVSRALSVAPAAWWGLRCAFACLGELLLRKAHDNGSRAGNDPVHQPLFARRTSSPVWSAEQRFRITEVFLAIVWCSAAAYLAFVFADGLMARWLRRYTPGATVVRLLALAALVAYMASRALALSGAAADQRLLLPAWVTITATLTALYHVTQRKMNIRRETSASLVVFAGASFVSMCALLAQVHLTREDGPTVPLVIMAGRAWKRGRGWAGRSGV